MNRLEPFLPRTRIAYFSMEIAIRPEMHTYSGGLGVLAGDMARSCADLALPVVFVSLVSRAGYVQQKIDSAGRQVAAANPWRPEDWAQPIGAMVAVQIEGRDVWIRPWLYLMTCPLGHQIPVLLLDTDLEQNSPEDRIITDRLYGDGDIFRFKQEVVLGIGGALMLQAIGFEITTYHLNEGHAALLTLYLLRRYRRPPEELRPNEPIYEPIHVRQHCVFTTHTPVEAAFDKYSYADVSRILGDYIEVDELRRLAGSDRLNMTQLALSLSGYVNGVSERHAETASRMFPGYRVHAITNGVHAPTWTHPSFARIYNDNFPHWAHEPEVLLRADQIPDQTIWQAHQEAKRELLAYVKAQSGVELQDSVPLIGFARRMTPYKRPDILFSDVARLSAIARERPFQVVFAGIAHPNDKQGQQMIAELNRIIAQLSGTVPMAYLANYDMAVAAKFVSGADIWLNTPLPPLEASGTSGMKAAFNGLLNFSVLDGWWIEACIEGVTGWAIGNDDGASDRASDVADLYKKLEKTILPLYYDDRARWIWMMKQAISKIGSYFNTQRVMRRYATEAYIR
jgi:glycogen phosphorylase